MSLIIPAIWEKKHSQKTSCSEESVTIICSFESMRGGDDCRLISVEVRGGRLNAKVIWSHYDSAQKTAKWSKCVSSVNCRCFISVKRPAQFWGSSLFFSESFTFDFPRSPTGFLLSCLLDFGFKNSPLEVFHNLLDGGSIRAEIQQYDCRPLIGQATLSVRLESCEKRSRKSPRFTHGCSLHFTPFSVYWNHLNPHIYTLAL